MTPSLATTVPDAVWQQIVGGVAVEAGFGASFVSRKVQGFEPVVRVEDAITWLDAYFTVMADRPRAVGRWSQPPQPARRSRVTRGAQDRNHSLLV